MLKEFVPTKKKSTLQRLLEVVFQAEERDKHSHETIERKQIKLTTKTQNRAKSINGEN